jgi:hypothetical protein
MGNSIPKEGFISDKIISLAINYQYVVLQRNAIEFNTKIFKFIIKGRIVHKNAPSPDEVN